MKKIALWGMLLTSFPVLAWGTLDKHEIDGFNRYCYYSDGGVSTVSSYSLCPTTNSEQGSNSNSPVIEKKGRNIGFGTLKSQSTKGFNRYCHYSNGAVKTIGSSELCSGTSG